MKTKLKAAAALMMLMAFMSIACLFIYQAFKFGGMSFSFARIGYPALVRTLAMAWSSSILLFAVLSYRRTILRAIGLAS